MSKSQRRTIADIEDDCGHDYGTPEFRAYVAEHHIDIRGDKKKLKDAPRGKHSMRKSSYLDD